MDRFDKNSDLTKVLLEKNEKKKTKNTQTKIMNQFGTNYPISVILQTLANYLQPLYII